MSACVATALGQNRSGYRHPRRGLTRERFICEPPRSWIQVQAAVIGTAYRPHRLPAFLDLDFSVKLGQLHHMTAEQARGFLSAARGTPLAAAFWSPICATRVKTALAAVSRCVG